MTSCREKLLRGLIACVGAVVIAFSCQAQAPAAPFQNLDFESAVIGTPVNFELPASQALPDWTNDHFHTGYVAYDTVAVGSVAISVQDSRTPYGSGPYLYPLQGQYSVMLQNGYGAGGIQDAWISQTGDVPSTARSLTFETDDVSLANIVVSLNGTPISMSLYSVGPVVNANLGPIETYIGDVSAFSGQQNVVLRFETVPTGDPYFGTADLDNIQFSSTPAPEPSTLFLLLAALLSSAGYYWHRRSDVPKAR